MNKYLYLFYWLESVTITELIDYFKNLTNVKNIFEYIAFEEILIEIL